MVCLSRAFRDLKELCFYPFWLLRGRPAPDNHIYKVKRIIATADRYRCTVFIETGTFYGQTVNAVKKSFEMVLSVELFVPLYNYNKKAFANNDNVTIYFGDSSSELKKMIDKSIGSILFWLDGHYSGGGTACGDIESPILAELETIKSNRNDMHCILIDDARLFTGTHGYPTLDKTISMLLEINPNYQIDIDCDCIVAVPLLVK